MTFLWKWGKRDKLIPDVIVEAARDGLFKYNVPASSSIAQWAVESEWGKHSPGNNPFGMKPRKGRNDPQQMLMTTEYLNGKKVRIPQPFRVFGSIVEAFDAHAELIATAPVYAPAMAALPNLDLFIDRMAKKYATAPDYAATIKSIIRSHSLAQYDTP